MTEPTFTSKTYPAKNESRALFFFAGFGTKSWMYMPAVRYLNKIGYTVHMYVLPGRPLLKVTNSYLAVIGRAILVDIRTKISAHKGISEFSIVGVSMGSAYALFIAKQLPVIKKLVLFTLYSSSALQIWEDPKLHKMKKDYTDRSMSMEEAAKLDTAGEAIHEIQKLKGKSLLLYRSLTDNVISKRNSQLFIDEARKHNLRLEVITGNGRHVSFIAKSLVKGKRWKAFLK